MKSPKRTIDLRLSNRQNVLQALYLAGSMSRKDLSIQTELSPGTVSNVISELIEDRIVIESGIVESEGGRPRAILTINPDYGFMIGVDFGETDVQLELFDLAMNRKSSVQRSVAQGESTPEFYIRLISEAINEIVKISGIQRSMIIGVGVGVPGVVGHNGEVSISAPMWNWKHVQFLAALEAETKLPAYIDNGAKAMAQAEAWFGAGRQAEDMVVLLLGTGIGAGVLTKGELYRGATNSAGEWGHTKISLDGRHCRCGSTGCVEAYAGAPGIIATMGLSGRMVEPAGDQKEILKNLVIDYQKNEIYAIRTLEETANFLGAGMVNLVNLFNPELIVIGGWLGLLIGELILPRLRKYIQANALPPSSENLSIGLCQFGPDAICVGAACLVLKEFLSANSKFLLPVDVSGALIG